MININKHREEMIYILRNIYGSTELASTLAFKGGTACYLFYDLPRFSTDLDFNLIDNDKTEEVLHTLEKILTQRGTIREKYVKELTVFLLYSYGTNDRNIKVEVSRRDYKDEYELLNYFGINMTVMKKEYMFAHKLVALTNRKREVSRDLFDINYFFDKHWDFKEDIIKVRTGKSTREYFEYLIEYIEKGFPKNKVLDGLGEVLDESKKGQIREHLKDDVLFKLRVYLENLEK